MKEYLIHLSLLLKRQFTNKLYICFLVAMPLFILIALCISSNTKGNDKVPVGCYIEKQDREFIKVLQESLNEASGKINFIEYDDLNEMLEDTASSALECSYVFTEELFDGLIEDDYKKTILRFTSPSTVVASMVDEMVFTAVFRAFGDTALCVYVDENPKTFAGHDADELKLALRNAYEKQLDTGHTFSLEFKAYGDAADTDKTSASRLPIHGIIAVFLFLCMLLACSDYCTELERGTLNMLSPRRQFVLSSCFIGSWLIPAFASSGLTLIIAATQRSLDVNLGITPGLSTVFYEIFVLITYFILLNISGLILNLIIKKSLLISALIPVLITGSLIFCPVIINLSAILPIAGVVEKLFLPYYYLIFF
ncbi:MAG: hypothetical protein E7261_04305 [Lachnospiraceae bacterium]|nr:hypothetical protein [Lachnospiraceae bacterium]